MDVLYAFCFIPEFYTGNEKKAGAQTPNTNTAHPRTRETKIYDADNTRRRGTGEGAEGTDTTKGRPGRHRDIKTQKLVRDLCSIFLGEKRRGKAGTGAGRARKEKARHRRRDGLGQAHRVPCVSGVRWARWH